MRFYDFLLLKRILFFFCFVSLVLFKKGIACEETMNSWQFSFRSLPGQVGFVFEASDKNDPNVKEGYCLSSDQKVFFQGKLERHEITLSELFELLRISEKNTIVVKSSSGEVLYIDYKKSKKSFIDFELSPGTLYYFSKMHHVSFLITDIIFKISERHKIPFVFVKNWLLSIAKMHGGESFDKISLEEIKQFSFDLEKLLEIQKNYSRILISVSQSHTKPIISSESIKISMNLLLDLYKHVDMNPELVEKVISQAFCKKRFYESYFDGKNSILKHIYVELDEAKKKKD